MREKFIPVSIEVHWSARRPDAEGRFIREALKRLSWNGAIAVTPNGKILNEEPYMDLAIQRGLEEWNKLPEAERRPGLKLDDLGPGDPAYDLAPPEGGLVLQTYIRSLERDARGELFRPSKVELGNAGGMPIEAQAQRDHLWISAAEAASIASIDAPKGRSLPAPAFLADRLFRFHLKDSATCIPGTSAVYYDGYAGELTLTVKESTSGLLKLGLSGLARGKGPDFQIFGEIEIDRSAKSLRRLDLLAYSEKGRVHTGTQATFPLGISFEIAKGNRPMDRVPPYFFTVNRWGSDPKAMHDAYFGPRK
ncbi:MAG TPA: hypothetical protein VF950_20505 [Planctomycetota bacterium]